MNLPKAIEILSIERKTAELQTDPDFYNALKLGIEALKRELYNRQHQPFLIFGKLPRETEE